MKAKEYFTTKRIAFMALFTALVAIATFIIQVPSPAGQGYINVGDTMIFVCAALFGPLFSFVAGGLGSAIADMFVAPYYAPFTFVVKGLEGLVAAYIIKGLKKVRCPRPAAYVTAFVAGGLLMSAGYMLAETVLFSWTLGVANFVYNLVQAAVNIVLGFALTMAFCKIRPINRLLDLDGGNAAGVKEGEERDENRGD